MTKTYKECGCVWRNAMCVQKCQKHQIADDFAEQLKELATDADRKEALGYIYESICELCGRDLSKTMSGKCYCAPIYDE